MKKLIAILACLGLSFSAFAATTVTFVDPALVEGQTTVEGTFFAKKDIVVRVMVDGVPAPHVQVDFNVDGGNATFVQGTTINTSDWAAFTDADGYAVAENLLGYYPGTGVLTARYSLVTSLPVPLTVTPGGPVRLEVFSGAHQRAPVNTTYALPWVAQAFDANGNVAPYAAVRFFATQDPTLPSGTFEGESVVWVRADANGLAVAPPFTANNVAGHEEGVAQGVRAGIAVTPAYFAYNNQPAGGSSGGGGEGCGRQGKGNGDCGNSPGHSDGQGNNGKGKG